jgi:hypothetical protein
LEQTVTTYTHKVTALNGLFLRTGPTVNFPKLGLMPYGTPLRVTSTDALGWHKIDLATNVTVSAKMNGTDLLQYNPQSPVSYGYCSAYYTEPWAPPPPPPTTRNPYRIGVHVIGNMRAAETALAAGAQVIFGMHDHLKMHQLALANPTKIFIYRGYIPGGQRPTPRDVFNQLQVGPDNPPNLWYVGTNENDHFGDDPEALRGRVIWDKDLFNMLKDVRSDIRYFGGSFGHGCPPGIEDPNGPVTAALMGYADLWNRGMGIDLHNYTKGKRFADDPVSDSPIHDPIWYERRSDFWFRNGILDPRKGGGFIHGETGVEANHGGYQWAGYNQQQFGRHIRTLSDLGRGQIVIPSGPYAGTWPSVDVAGAIYQMGDTNTGPGGWGGYNVENMLPELRTFWAEGR